jgi:carbamoyl-phosphate synthase small subunit
VKALIALEDGKVFRGRAFAGSGEVYGELVFNTSMTGYQEILTDPSYAGQIVTLTYPLIGNYGVNEEDVESSKPRPTGLVIGECSRIRSNWRSTMSLPDYLEKHGIMGIDQVDTRAVTLHIRSRGAMKCVMSTEEPDPEALVEKARRSRGMEGSDLASEVSTTERYLWPGSDVSPKRSVAVLDCGVKFNQLRILKDLGCRVEVFPMHTPAEEILAASPDGFFVSNGPGDPATVPGVVAMVKTLVETGLPTFGICFGHQLMGQALGGSTYKLKFGHRGGNQPVKDLDTGRVEITSQNHGFCVDKATLNPEFVETTHINLNDETSEGLRHKKLPVFSVQYHPEACPGPHDAEHLFTRFVQLIEAGRA